MELFVLLVTLKAADRIDINVLIMDSFVVWLPVLDTTKYWRYGELASTVGQTQPISSFHVAHLIIMDAFFDLSHQPQEAAEYDISITIQHMQQKYKMENLCKKKVEWHVGLNTRSMKCWKINVCTATQIISQG